MSRRLFEDRGDAAAFTVTDVRDSVVYVLRACLGPGSDSAAFLAEASRAQAVGWVLAAAVEGWSETDRARVGTMTSPDAELMVSEPDLCRVLTLAIDAVRPLAGPEPEAISTDPASMTMAALLDLAELMIEFEGPDAALRCAMSASAMGVVWAVATSASTGRIAAITRRHGTPMGRAYSQFRYVEALLADVGNPSARRDAFDAFEDALSQMQGVEEKAELLPVLAALLREPAFTTLAPLAVVAAGAAPPEIAEEVGRLVDPRWSGPTSQIAEELPRFSDLAISIEDARLALEPPMPDDVIHADWTTWAFDHPSFRRTVPQGSSILKSADAEEHVLDVAHELTHVMSMRGGLGWANLALRYAAFLIEQRLTGMVTEAAGTAAGPDDLPMPLTEPDVLALLWADQSTDIARKQRVLAAVWGPWLEGIAVFGELASDGRDDPTASPVGQAVANLVDVDLTHTPPDEGRSRQERFDEALAAGEARYAAAIDARGRDRLRNYFGGPYRKYAPGYLATRAVVSAWRDRSPGPLTGSEAFRVLLHATRFGIYDAIAPFDLSVDDFETRSVEQMLAWVAAIADLPVDAIELLARGVRSARWADGRVVLVEHGDASTADEGEDRFVEWVRQATLFVDDRPERFGASADPDVVGLIGALGRLVAETGLDDEIARDLVRRDMQVSTVLPIASAEAPFWLADDPPGIVALVRSREPEDDRTGSYSLFVLSLAAADHASISEHLAEGGPRRLTAIRFADVADPDLESARGFGRHFLTLQYGDWLHVDARGLYRGSDPGDSATAALRRRVLPDPVATAERRLANGLEAATRTRTWLDGLGGTGWRARSTPLDLDLEPWRAAVAAATEQVGEEAWREFEAAVGLRLLGQALGPDAVGAHAGLKGLVGDAPTAECIELLLRSGIRRGAEAPEGMRFVARGPDGWDIRAHPQTEGDRP